jgi:hypothetical protein
MTALKLVTESTEADTTTADAAPIGKIIQYGIVWNPDTGRYQFLIYGPDHVGPKRAPVLAVPIYEDGKFIDLLLIGDDLSFETACCNATWLGRENLSGPVVRLHPNPTQWLESGCTGVCHIEPIGRKALKDLQAATTIQCNDIHTALEAWDWGFGGEDDELARFSIDDTPGNVRSYFEDEVKWHAMRVAIDVGAHR